MAKLIGVVVLTAEECAGIVDTISLLSGHNPEYAFGDGDSDDATDPAMTGLAKVYIAGDSANLVPKHLGGTRR